MNLSKKILMSLVAITCAGTFYCSAAGNYTGGYGILIDDNKVISDDILNVKYDKKDNQITLGKSKETAATQKQKVRISFISNDHLIGAFYSDPKENKLEIQDPLIPRPISPNHTFVEWNTSPAGTGKSFSPEELKDKVFDKNFTLYAVWKKSRTPVPSDPSKTYIEDYVGKPGTDPNPNGDNPEDYYSFGTSTREKLSDPIKITNLSNGAVSKTSTDAINGSQLYDVAKGISSDIDFEKWKEKLGINQSITNQSSNNFEIKAGDRIWIEKKEEPGTNPPADGDPSITGKDKNADETAPDTPNVDASDDGKISVTPPRDNKEPGKSTSNNPDNNTTPPINPPADGDPSITGKDENTDETAPAAPNVDASDDGKISVTPPRDNKGSHIRFTRNAPTPINSAKTTGASKTIYTIYSDDVIVNTKNDSLISVTKTDILRKGSKENIDDKDDIVGKTYTIDTSKLQDVLNQKADKTDITNAVKDKADVNAGNVTGENKKAWQEKLGDGKIAAGDKGLVNGDTVYQAIKDKADKTDITNAVKDKADTDLKNITNDGKTVIKNIAKDSVKVVDGTNTKVTETTDKDGNKNYAVNVEANGKIEKNNNNIVTGGAVYQAIEDKSLVKTDGNTISIDRTGTANVIDVSHTVNGKSEGRVITGVVTDPGNPYSAANVSYVNTSISNVLQEMTSGMSRLEKDVSNVGAGAAALSALEYDEIEPGQKWQIAAGVGNYKGSTAYALGAKYHLNNDISFHIGSTVGNGNNMVNGGFSIALGHAKKKIDNDSMKRLDEMQKEINALKEQNKQLIQALEKVNKLFLLNPSKKASFPDVPADHWAKNAVDVLHGNGAIEGYPDGTFKGDRNMSRYEYAEMLYNALMNGATVDESVIEKYQPELVQIYSEKNR